MENNVTKYHLVTLATLRRLFEKIRDEKYIDIDLVIQYLLVIRVLKNKVNDYYIEIMSNFKDESNIQKLYEIFKFNILVNTYIYKSLLVHIMLRIINICLYYIKTIE